MKKSLYKKGLVLGIIILFVGAGVIPTTVGNIEKKTTFTTISSPGYIQDLIDNASDGDTIHIPSGIYNENIVINKSISLIGEDKDTTIIDGGGNGTVIYVSNDVTISGFTIQNGDNGIALHKSNRNTIKGNSIISNNENGINILGSYLNIISGNNINSNNETGILISLSGGFFPLTPSFFNIIKGNNISNNENGVNIYSSILSFVIKNNFIDNNRDAYFADSFLNRWRQNYWNESRKLPKLIFGEIYMGNFKQWINWINIDWRPAKEPYDI